MMIPATSPLSSFMSNNDTTNIYRLAILPNLFLIAAVVLAIGRVFNLAVIDQPFLRHQGDERVLRLVSMPGFAG